MLAPQEAKIDTPPRERIVTTARVRAVVESTTAEYVSGYGKDAVFRNVSLGWWIHFDGNWSMCVGAEKPKISAGDTVRITIEPK